LEQHHQFWSPPRGFFLKISSPQSSRIPRSTIQRPTAFRQLRDQFRADFEAAFPDTDTSDLFFEVPDYQAHHNLLFPDYILPTQISSHPSIVPSIPVIPMAANVIPMPARGHSTAPKFSPNQPRTLKRYFKELEILFDSSGILTNEEKKKHACRYLDVDSAELWESIKEFAVPHTFEQFKDAIYKMYASSEEERKWTITDMDKLVGEQLRIGIFDANDLGIYYQAFFTITTFLINKNRLSEAEQSRAFVRGFQSDLWKQIVRRLELKLPDHHPDDHYPIADVHAAAKYVLHGTSPPTCLQKSSTSTSTPSSTTTAVESEDL
jgi:hypothetical protein